MNFGWLKLSDKHLENFYQLDTKKSLRTWGSIGLYSANFRVHCFGTRWNHVLYRGQVLEILLNGLVEPGRAESKWPIDVDFWLDRNHSPPQKKRKNGFKWHDVYYSKLEGSENTKISVYIDMVGSHEHSSQKCMNCWFVLTFQQRSVWRILFKKFNTHTHTKKTKVFNSFNFQFLPRNPPFSTFQNHQGEPSGHLGSLKFRHFRRNLICIEPYSGKSAGLKCDRTKSMEAPWIEKQDLFWVERINFVLAPMYMLNKYSNYIWIYINVYLYVHPNNWFLHYVLTKIHSWTPSFWKDFWMCFFW